MVVRGGEEGPGRFHAGVCATRPGPGAGCGGRGGGPARGGRGDPVSAAGAVFGPLAVRARVPAEGASAAGLVFGEDSGSAGAAAPRLAAVRGPGVPAAARGEPGPRGVAPPARLPRAPR